MAYVNRNHEYIREYTIDNEQNVTEIASVMRHVTIQEDGVNQSRTEAVVAYYRPYPKERLSFLQRKELQAHSFVRDKWSITSKEADNIKKEFENDPFSIFFFTPSN